MSREMFEVDDPKISAITQDIARRIAGAAPRGWGFLLMLFEYGTPERPGNTFYAATADRPDALRMLREWIQKQEGGALNPDHPVTQAVDQNWHKIVAILLHMLGAEEIIIKPEDIIAFQQSGRRTIAAEDSKEIGGLRLRLVEDAEVPAILQQERERGARQQ